MYSITSAQIFIPKRAILRFSVGAQYGLVVQAPQPVVDERGSGPYGKQSRVLPHRPLQNQVFLDVQSAAAHVDIVSHDSTETRMFPVASGTNECHGAFGGSRRMRGVTQRQRRLT